MKSRKFLNKFSGALTLDLSWILGEYTSSFGAST